MESSPSILTSTANADRPGSFLRDLYTGLRRNWKLPRGARYPPDARITVPYERSRVNRVLPASLKCRLEGARTALAEAGGIALVPSAGAQPAAVCGPEGNHAADVSDLPPRRERRQHGLQQMQVGTTINSPCYVDGCAVIGDVHYAQGDGRSPARR